MYGNDNWAKGSERRKQNLEVKWEALKGDVVRCEARTLRDLLLSKMRMFSKTIFLQIHFAFHFACSCNIKHYHFNTFSINNTICSDSFFVSLNCYSQMREIINHIHAALSLKDSHLKSTRVSSESLKIHNFALYLSLSSFTALMDSCYL